MPASWRQVRLAAGDVQLIILDAVIRRRAVLRSDVPSVIERQTLVESLGTHTGSTNVQDIADRLAAGGVIVRSERPVTFSPNRQTHVIFELLVHGLNGGRGPLKGITDGRPAQTIVLEAPRVFEMLDEVLNAVRALRPGERSSH